METSFKIVLDKRRAKKNNTFPLRIRVYQGRIYKTHSLGIDLRECDWDDQIQVVKASNPNHQLYNLKISNVKTKLQKSLFLNEDDGSLASPEDLILQITQNSPRKLQKAQTDIFAYGSQHIAKLKSEGHIGNSIVYSCAINKLKNFANKDKLPFEEMSYSFIERFNTALLTEGMKLNAVSNYLRTIRALFNKAIREDIIPTSCYPFSKFKIKTERTINRTLTIAEIAKIAALDLPVNSKIWHHRNLFMLSFCLIGINFSDLLTLNQESIIDGRVIFRRRKTHKVYSILLQPTAKEIIGHYISIGCENNKSFILPFVVNKNNPVELKKDIMQAIKNTNEHLRKLAALCGIKKPVSTYYARYTWANIARSLGFSKDLISEALGHSYGNAVTGIYLDDYGSELIDEINAKVITAVIGK